MKTILVDAAGTFVTKEGINSEMYELLETYSNQKIIVTNANSEQQKTFNLINLPYKMFTQNQSPTKLFPEYFHSLFLAYGLKPAEVVYFEHAHEAVEVAKSLGIVTYHYDSDKKDISALKSFLDKHLA